MAELQRKRVQLFLLDRSKSRASYFDMLRPRLISSIAQLRNALPQAARNSVWISYAGDLTAALVKNASHTRSTFASGLFIHPLDRYTIPALSSFFRQIAFTLDGVFIPAAELAEVLESEKRADLFIGGSVHRETETITFWRGNMMPLTVPFSSFAKSGTGTTPDFDKLAVIDSGQTVQLGEYEAAVEAILYEYDPIFRRRLSKQRLQQDRSFGAALRRLRKQRGLRREDFAPDLSAKTIARIEQGKVRRIHAKTRNALAKYLAVKPDEIATF